MTSISSGTSEGNPGFTRPLTGTPVGDEFVAHSSGFSLHNETYKTEGPFGNTVYRNLLFFLFIIFFFS
jgi:hypothetical protein